MRFLFILSLLLMLQSAFAYQEYECTRDGWTNKVTLEINHIDLEDEIVLYTVHLFHNDNPYITAEDAEGKIDAEEFSALDGFKNVKITIRPKFDKDEIRLIGEVEVGPKNIGTFDCVTK